MNIVKAGLLLLLCSIIAGCGPVFTDAPGETLPSPDEVMRVFLLHDYKERRSQEALLFINGY